MIKRKQGGFVLIDFFVLAIFVVGIGLSLAIFVALDFSSPAVYLIKQQVKDAESLSNELKNVITKSLTSKSSNTSFYASVKKDNKGKTITPVIPNGTVGGDVLAPFLLGYNLGRHIQSVAVSTEGRITVTMADNDFPTGANVYVLAPATANGVALNLQKANSSETINWTCNSNDDAVGMALTIDRKYLPSNCK